MRNLLLAGLLLVLVVPAASAADGRTTALEVVQGWLAELWGSVGEIVTGDRAGTSISLNNSTDDEEEEVDPPAPPEGVMGMIVPNG